MDNLSDIFLKKFRNAKSDQKFARRGVAPRKKNVPKRRSVSRSSERELQERRSSVSVTKTPLDSLLNSRVISSNCDTRWKYTRIFCDEADVLWIGHCYRVVSYKVSHATATIFIYCTPHLSSSHSRLIKCISLLWLQQTQLDAKRGET
jgi:hypothetical protein